MLIVKIVSIAIIAAIFCIYLKKYSPDIAVFVSISAGVIILFLLGDYLLDFANFFKDFFLQSGMDSELLKIIVKITVIAYLVEFSAQLVSDLGENGLSGKIMLSGKILILVMALPIVTNLFELIKSVVGGM
jgi:stage III sporulation protein AD